MPAPTADQALPRFLAIAQALRANGSYFEDWTMLQLSALALPMVDGEPEALARAMRETMTALRKGAKWWNSLGGSLRAFTATSLIQAGSDANGFYEELARVRKLFREAKLPRGSVSEVLGFLLLSDLAPDRRVRPNDVQGMG